jgi:hypothetical protein
MVTQIHGEERRQNMEQENSHFQDCSITIIGRKWNCDKRWPHFRPPQMRSEETAPFSRAWVDDMVWGGGKSCPWR